MTETELLFTEVLNCNRLSLYLNKDTFLDKAKSSLISGTLKRRACGEPLHYILGKIEFMGLEFQINSDVLIPRPETEIVVETAMKIVCRFAGLPVCRFKILDIGTGSGCIAVSLAKFLSHADITATDISFAALEVAKQNSIQNNVKVNFIESDLFANHELQITNYDLIVSNPPYIKTEEIDELQPELSFEPRVALDGGNDGLDFYRRIIDKAPRYLKEGAFLIMEIGFDQRIAIENIFQNSGSFKAIEVIKDYSGIDRVIIAQRSCQMSDVSRKSSVVSCKSQVVVS